MGGKASLFLVLGFSAIFLVMGHNFNNITLRSVDNSSEYFERTVAHNIAVSAANFAANKLFLDQNWNTGYSDIPFQGGKYSVTVQSLSLGKKEILATGIYNIDTAVVKIILQPSSFSKFGYYMNIFPGNGFFYTGDTLSGPFHTQGQLITKGSPVFLGKATAKQGLKMLAPKDPKFVGGFQSGVDVPFNLDMSKMISVANSGGYVFRDSVSGRPTDAKLQFNTDGTITYQTKLTSSSTWSTSKTVAGKTLAPNGVIFVEKGNLYVSGTVSGKYTVGAGLSSGDANGNIYLENDIVYKTNPLKHPNSKDLLGLVAANETIVEDNAANRNDIHIDASIFNYKGGLSVENISSIPASGTMYIIGGLIEYQAQVTGEIGWDGSLVHGYHENIKYDQRLMLETPPYFPATQRYEIVSWYE